MADEVVSWKPLGVLLVDRGLLTLEELDDALEEQSRTGERLGAILVRRKVIAGVVLTTILAEQVGVELETQRGYGSGLFSKISKRSGLTDAPARVRSTPALPAPALEDDAGSTPDREELEFELSALRAELDGLRARNAELEAELAALKAKKPAARRKTSKSAA